MKPLRFIIIILSIIQLSCNSEDAWDFLKSAGKTITIERDISTFIEIEMLDRVNVEIYQDTIEKLFITGPQNLLPKVGTSVSQGVLTIIDENTFNWVRNYEHRITVRIHVKKLRHINYEGIGDIISVNQLVSDTLTIRSQQSSGNVYLDVELEYFHCYFNQSLVDLTIRGTAQKVHAQINGTGFLRCQELITPWCTAYNQGSGDILVFSSGFLYGIIEDSGNVLYTGNPTNTVFEYKGRGNGNFIEF